MYLQTGLLFQVLREGMGQAAHLTSKDTLDTVITNALIVDAVAGIIKADVGIKVRRRVVSSTDYSFHPSLR